MKTSTKFQIAFFLVAIPVIAIFIWRGYLTAAENQRNLEREFGQITRPASLIKVQETRHHKPGVAWVHARYSATPPVGDIEEIYRSELLKNGWTFHERRNYPGNIEAVEFCKNDYAAVVEVIPAQFSQQVWFSMDWGLNKCPSFRVSGSPRSTVVPN